MQNYLSAIGDSITSGNGQTTPYPSIVVLPGNSYNANFGISGQLLSTINTNISTYFPVGRSNNIAVLWAGTNDLVGGTAPATLITTLLSAAASLKAVGYKVIVPTVIDRSGLNETTRATYNGLILSNAASFDAVVNFDLTPLGVNGNSGNATYFIDGVHPTQFSVNTIIAPSIQTAINTFSYPGSAQTKFKTTQYRANHNDPLARLILNAAISPTDVMVVCAWWNSAAGNFISFTDTSSLLTWTQIGSIQTVGAFSVAYFKGVSTITGTTVLQLNLTALPANYGIVCEQFSLPDGASNLTLQSNLFTGSGTSISSGSLTTKVGDQLCMLGFAANFGFTTTPGSGFTVRVTGADASFAEDKLSAGGSQNGTATLNQSLAFGAAFLDFNVVLTYSVPDCRIYGNFPNASRTVQNTLIYDVQTSSNHAVPSTDSRATGAPADARTSANIPTNSRTPGTYGPGVN